MMSFKDKAKNSEAYQEWLSLFDAGSELVWKNEDRKELKRVSTIYYAFQKEFLKIQSSLSSKIEELRSQQKTIERLQSASNNKSRNCNVSKNLEKTLSDNKENTRFPGVGQSLELDLNDGANRGIIKLNSSTTSPLSSPILNENKSISSPSLLFCSRAKPSTVNQKRKNESWDDPDCSIIENSPQPQPLKKTKLSLNVRKGGKVAQKSTLTQMINKNLNEKEKEKLDTASTSIVIDDLLSLIDESDSDLSDTTIDSLDNFPLMDSPKKLVENKTKASIPDNSPPRKQFVKSRSEVVRGKDRKKLAGWSCKDCEKLYSGLGSAERQKKLNECSRHRTPPRDDTFPGFWDLTFGPTPPTQRRPSPPPDSESPQSLIFNYNHVRRNK